MAFKNIKIVVPFDRLRAFDSSVLKHTTIVSLALAVVGDHERVIESNGGDGGS